MTHDELLNKITYERKFDEGLSNNALRAVVELHKPETRYEGGPLYCSVCYAEGESPCPTIQAIEKELA